MRPRAARGTCAALGLLAFVAGCDDCKGGEGAGPSTPAPEASASSSAPSPIPSAAISAGVNPRGLPAYAGPTGSVEGLVTISGDPPPDLPGLDFKRCPDAEKTYKKLFRAGPPIAGGDAGPPRYPLADAVVVITGYAGFYLPETSPSVRIVFDGCAFPRRAVTMTFGQSLEVANRSKFVFAPALTGVDQPAMRVAPPEEKGDPVTLVPPKPDHYFLVDRLGAAWLQTRVYVLPQPLHTVTGPDGRFRIDRVPIGKLTVGARLGDIQRETTVPVEVRAGVVENVTLNLEYATPPTPPPSFAGDAGPRLH